MKLTDLITVAEYAHDNDLTSTPGWKWSKHVVNNPKKLVRMARIFRSQEKDRIVKFKYGVRIPRNRKEALLFDKNEGNSKWQDAINAEINQLLDYDTFVIVKN